MFQLLSVSRPLPWDCRLMPKPWTFLWVTPGGRFQIMGPFERWFDQLGSLFFLRMVEYCRVDPPCETMT